ncbi:MAG: hypothetical protein FJ316_13230 [SAR202 cluster bacterium]|nr:hypothetical protein [SAR202 cluster bacterium]
MASTPGIISHEYPYLPVAVELRGRTVRSSALIDTRFSGSLVVPATWLDPSLGLPDGYGRWELADGRAVRAPVYLGSVEIVGLVRIPQIVITVLGNEYVIGRRILDRFEITLDRGQKLIL